MSAKPKHARRLSLFGLGASQLLSSAGGDKSQPNTTASITISINGHGKQNDEKTAPYETQRTIIRRKLSKKRTSPQQKTQPTATSPPPTSYSLSNTQLSELSHETDVPHTDYRRPSVKRKTSMNIRAALSSIFVAKPSKRTVSGILDGIEGVGGGKPSTSRRTNESRSICHYESRSPSPPSPEIRPPSGLGQIASSVDLSTYVQEEYEASIAACLSGSASRAPSIALDVPTPFSDDTTPETKSISGRELFYQPWTKRPSAPSQMLKFAIDLSMSFFDLDTLSSLAATNCDFLHLARMSLYTNVDSDDIGEDEGRRRRLLQTIATNSDIAGMVRSFRWLCLHPPSSSSSSSHSMRRSIPRRIPTISLSSSPEEYVLPHVLTSVPNLEMLVLLLPHTSILQTFLPTRHELSRSSSVSALSPSSQLTSPPVLSSLRSLTLSGRTTVSTAFGSVLTRFLELHPGISELNLPDVFCLPNVPTLSRPGSASSSPSASPISPSRHELIPPVPPLPPSYAAMKDKEPSLPMLPNLTRLSAPLTLATQLVPGRPVRVVDVELTTSLYEGLRPREVARIFAEARDLPEGSEGTDSKTNWRAARHSRRFGAGLSPVPSPISPLYSPGAGLCEETNLLNWRAARQARRAGITKSIAVVNQGPSLRELKLRCTAKVDYRTIGRVLISFGKELGGVLEALAIEWSGKETDLLTLLSLTLSRFTALKRLEISALVVPEDDEDADDVDSDDSHQRSDADQDAKIEVERNLVEQWSQMCALLSHIEFASGRIWRAN